MRATVQSIYVTILTSLGFYGLALLACYAFIWSDAMAQNLALEPTLVASWLTLVISISAIIPGFTPRFLRRPRKPGQIIAILTSISVIGVLFAGMGMMLGTLYGLPPSDAAFLALPALAAAGMLASLGVWLCLRRSDYAVPPVAAPVPHTPAPQLSLTRSVFQTRRHSAVPAE